MNALMAAQYRGINPLLALDEARRDRWSALTDPTELARQMHGVSRNDPETVDNKRLILEALLDNQLRAAAMGPTSGSMFGDHSAAGPLFENFAKKLEEASTMGWNAAGTVPAEAAAGSESFRWTTASLGILRRSFPKLIAPDLVSVQPMSQPTGKAFYLYHKYAEALGTIATTDEVSRYFDFGDNSASPDFGTALWDDSDMAKYSGRKAGSGTDDTANEEGSTPRQLTMALNSRDLTAKSRKLLTEFSVELEQDLRAYFGLSAESELMNAVSGELAREIDRDIINDLHTSVTSDNTPGTMIVTWRANGGYTGTLPTEIKAAQEGVYDSLEDAAALIETRAYVRPTWILTNVKGATMLRKLNSFEAVPGSDPSRMSANMGGRRIYGTLASGYWNIYVDPWYKASDTYPWFLMGYKGSSFMETGYVYAPYVPLYRTSMLEVPSTMLKSASLMSRYAKRMLQLRYYAAVQTIES